MIDYATIKSRVSISEILIKYGINTPDHGRYHVLCPWHIERTASLSVNNDKGLFHCFGCGASGSVIDLVARFEKISPREAADRLSRDFEIGESTMFRSEALSTRARITDWKTKKNIKAVSIPYDLRELPSGYRELSKRAINHFALSLTDHGVFIPHFDLAGRIIGYSIRRPDGLHPKYLNSVGFPKGIPYGTYQNKEEIIKRGFAIVTEGQFDAITLWDRGYKNVVSLMGSSMQEQQAHLLLSLTTRLLILFDGDKPGRIGAAHVDRRWSSCFSTHVELLPNGIDPAEWCLSNDLGTEWSRQDDFPGAI